MHVHSPHPASQVSLHTLVPLPVVKDPSPSFFTLQEALRDRLQEAVDMDRGNMWLPKLWGKQYMFARAGSAGLLGRWPLGDSYIGISQWGPSMVSSPVLELVYSLILPALQVTQTK